LELEVSLELGSWSLELLTMDALFYIFAALTLICGVLVIVNPFSNNPVTSAMFLVLTIVSMAGLFVLLHAFFLAAVQVLVYAGAVMVLFLFVIMLLDLKEEQRRKIPLFSAGLGIVAVVAIASVVIGRLWDGPFHYANEPAVVEGNTALLGTKLFSDYVLPFEIVSLVLLVAMIGAILLSKKELK
jgi:NADH-quinone oxidoreductase subunit J